jgi:hypothetical protein
VPAKTRRAGQATAKHKPIAEKLYQQGFTEQQIADQFGVTQKTISRDLADCCAPQQSKTTKTATNPKGAGRPKGSKKRRDFLAPRTARAKLRIAFASLVRLSRRRSSTQPPILGHPVAEVAGPIPAPRSMIRPRQ